MDDKPLTDNELRALLARVPRVGTPPEPGLLAAWLEGGLDAPQAERVEAWLAQNADARRALLALREAQPESVPEAELAKLRALVPPMAVARPPRVAGWHERLAAWFPSPRVAIAAVVLVAASAWLGLAAGERLADQQWQRQAATALQGGFLLDAGV